MKLARGVIFLLLLLFGNPAWSQTTGFFKSIRHTKARLLLSHESARPGETIFAGIELTMSAGWHTYWQNYGDLGKETKIHWALPPDISAGPVEWPLPEKLTAEGLTTYVYHDRAVLVVPLTISSNAAAGARELNGLVTWLECEKACVPGSNMVSATLTVASESKPGPDAGLLAEAQRKLPPRQIPGTVVARWDQPPTATNRAFTIEWNVEAQEPDFFPFTNALVTVSAKTEVLTSSGGKVILRKTAERTDTQWTKEIRGLLVRKENGALKGYEVALAMADASSSAGLTSAGVPAAATKKSTWGWLLYAFLGGLILNIMPCVLPVIALKILGFVAQSRDHPRRVKTLGTIYALGVLASFLVLAGIVIGVKAAGHRAGWGMQFGNPQFIVILAVVVTLVALNLFGVFEVTLGGRAMSAASGAASRHGATGAFMNGVLATVLATPCTAPFLGAALGFAFAQSAAMIVLFFLTIGLGLALPYLILSWNPRLLKILPKPGPWMERFKVAMGFPMVATVAWLVSLTLPFYGRRFLWLCMFLVVLAMAAWIFGEFFQRGVKRRGMAILVVLLLLAGGFMFAVEGQLRWRNPVDETVQSAETFQLVPGGLAWRRWSPEAVANAQKAGRPILVDFTAEWCITCQTVVKPGIENDRVRARLKEIDAVALLADDTKKPPLIAAELEKFERAGVPLVVVYPKDPAKPPIVIPEVITSAACSKEILKALDEVVN